MMKRPAGAATSRSSLPSEFDAAIVEISLVSALVDCNINLAFKSGEPFDSAQGERPKEFRSW